MSENPYLSNMISMLQNGPKINEQNPIQQTVKYLQNTNPVSGKQETGPLQNLNIFMAQVAGLLDREYEKQKINEHYTPEKEAAYLKKLDADFSKVLGYNLVLRYLEAGDTVIASVRRPSEAIEKLKEKYGEKLIVITMDLLDTDSVNAAAREAAEKVDHIDILINNAVGVSPDCDKGFFEADLDYIAKTIDIIAVGTMRVIKAFYPLLIKSSDTALIMNISSEAGSIEKCYRKNMIDYGMGKAALNMATMNLYNTFKEEGKVNIFAVHPGWIRTDGKDDNPAPLSSYEAAGILKDLFSERRYDLTGHRFITNEGEDYPF